MIDRRWIGIGPGSTHQILCIFPRSLIWTSEHAKDGGDLSRFMEVKNGKVHPSFPDQHSSVLRVPARASASANPHQTPTPHFGGDRLVRHHRRSGRLGRDRAVRHHRRDWLARFVDLSHGIPSHDTFGRVFAALDPVAFQKCLLAWVQRLHEVTRGQVIAIDGKVAREAMARAGDQGPLTLVSALGDGEPRLLGPGGRRHRFQ